MPSAKHLRLEVPNYNHDAGSQTNPYSFVQLGAAPAQADDPGYDLLVEAGLATDKIFKDDFRHANSQQHPSAVYSRDDGTSLAIADAPTRTPIELTNELLTRGGWRQHTDGNHISTTRGDRVDVIFGNHKMVVYGRMDQPNTDWGETYWETSGGHQRWATNTQGDMVMVEWNASRDTWRTYEETIKGDLIDRYQGVVEEINESPTLESYVGSRAAPASAAIPNADSDNPHEQTTLASGWVNPARGFGGTATAANNTLGRRRPKENPDVTTTVKAGKIDEIVKVTNGMGAAGADAFSDLMKPTTATITAPGSTGTLAIADVVNGAFGTYDPAIRLPTGGWQAPCIGSGWMVETQHVETKSYELTLTTLHEEKTTVDAGVTINSQTGLRPTLSAAGIITSEPAARRINHVTDVGINIVKFGEEMYLIRKSSGYGGWTFNLSLVGMSIGISMGVTMEIPNFEKIGETGGRHQFGLTLASTTDIGVSASIDIKLLAHFKFSTKKEEIDLGPTFKAGLVKLKATLKENANKLAQTKTNAVRLSMSANLTET
jgi:hypothetical protein